MSQEVYMRVQSDEEFQERLEQAFMSVARGVAERIRELIKTTAELEPNVGKPVPKGQLTAYYANKTMPVFSGEMLESMTAVETDGQTYSFSIKAPYASEIEWGDLRLVSNELSNPKMQVWIHGRKANLDPASMIGNAHPFIIPRIREVLQNDLPLIVSSELFTSLSD